VPLPHPRPILDASRRTHWKGRAGIAAALIVGVAAVSAWLAWPIERTQVAILPVVNQTGDRELDEYRLALTYELVGRLSESASVRVWPYERMLPILRRFRARDDDVSSLASSGAITEHSGATTIIVPTLIYEDRRWKGRIELRSAATGATEGTYETEPQVSALATETSRALMATMASRVEEHFIRTAPFGADAKVRLRRLLGREVAAPGGRRWRTLDVVAAFEKGLNAFGDLEYATAAGFFATASQLDATNSLVHAWHSRALRMMRSDEESTQAADLALRTLTEDTPTQDRLLVEAIASEARNAMTAESRYRALVDRDRDDVNAMMELAAFFDRQGRNDEAVEAYTGALTIDAHAYTADIELCRMYNRLGQSLMARERAARARTTFQNLRAPSYEAHALMCLADSLRSGGASELREARQAATGALSLFEQLGAVYNIPRAFNYLATIAGLQRNRGEALAFGEQALAAARSGSNIVIQPLVLMNLGVTSSAIGDHGRAAEYYQESYTRYRALGDQARAAEIQANRGALLIDFGPNPADGLREVENALEVVTEQRNNDFEAFCLEVIARYYRAAGLRSQAESYLNRARSIARQFGFQDKVASADIQSGRVALEAADYTPALDRLGEGLQASADVGLRAEGLIHLSRVRARIGDFDGARSELAKVPGALEGRDFHLLPILHFAQGELAFEMNRLADAKASFEEAASASGGDLPDPVSVEAAAYVGLLDALAGQRAGRRAIESCRDYALMMGRKPLEARCRVFLARLLVEAGSYRDALTTLGAIPEDDTRFTIGAELRAQVHYWRKRAFIGLHDFEAAEMEGRSALQLIETTRRSVPEEFRSAFDSRPEIRRTLS
jgi:tetratricopeptide (TPR) repeat protein